MRDSEIVRLAVAQRKKGADLLAWAFEHDPLYEMLIPEETRRARVLTWLFDRVIGYALRYGEVYTTARVEGVACWLCPGQVKLTMGRVLRSGLYATPLKMGVAAYRQFGIYMRYTEAIHECFAPRSHWYVWAIGVAPSNQGTGIGSQLLQPVLAKSSAAGTASYLETGIERNVRFYERHGFRVVSHGKVTGQGLPVWAMRRDSPAT
jgi:ribosomal protein S18 acetylase RimI-like enzyme